MPGMTTCSPASTTCTPSGRSRQSEIRSILPSRTCRVLGPVPVGVTTRRERTTRADIRAAAYHSRSPRGCRRRHAPTSRDRENRGTRSAMHLNALYRAAEAGRQALSACMNALTSAARWRGYDPRALLGKPLKYWHLRQAQHHFEEAKRHLHIVRENVSLVAALGQPVQIDSSGGYAVADLLVGGLLDAITDIRIDKRIEARIEQLDILRAQVEELMLRMRKAGAVG